MRGWGLAPPFRCTLPTGSSRPHPCFLHPQRLPPQGRLTWVWRSTGYSPRWCEGAALWPGTQAGAEHIQCLSEGWVRLEGQVSRGPSVRPLGHTVIPLTSCGGDQASGGLRAVTQSLPRGPGDGSSCRFPKAVGSSDPGVLVGSRASWGPCCPRYPSFLMLLSGWWVLVRVHCPGPSPLVPPSSPRKVCSGLV